MDIVYWLFAAVVIAVVIVIVIGRKRNIKSRTKKGEGGGPTNPTGPV